MEARTRILIAGGVIGSLSALGVSLADDGGQPLTGETRDRAVAAALEHVGEGTVVETEVGDDGAAYEVEIVLEDGRQVEVNLDEDFEVLGVELDDD